MYIFFRFVWVYSPIFVTFVDDNITDALMGKWMRRRLNSKGYGVQSPNDFYFVQHVLREEAPYYAYSALEEVVQNYADRLPCYPVKVNRLLFRLANYVHPERIVEVGAGISLIAMAMACPTTRCVGVTSDPAYGDRLGQLLATYLCAEVKNGDEKVVFGDLLHEMGAIGLLHIAHTARYEEIMEAALPYMADRALVIIEGIDSCKEKQGWWERQCDKQEAGVCYDLGSVGLLFLDHARHKENYWIKLRK